MSSVDVVIPCYKYAHFLRECVQGVLGQPGVDVRVLIIDDCSPDNTPEVGQQLAAEDKRVEYRRHAVNRGHIATYNEGLLEWAAADYSVLLSADDLLTPGSLGRSTKLMDAHPQVVMTHGREIRTNTPASESIPNSDSRSSLIMSSAEFWERSCEHAGNLVSTPTAVVRTAMQKSLGGYRRELPHTGDMEMWLRFAAHGSIGFVDAVQAFYRLHGQNMSVDFPGIRDIQQRAEAFVVLFREHGSRLAERDRLERLAFRELALCAFWAGCARFDAAELRKCREFHELAVRFCPAITRSAAWWRFRCKRLMGPRLWSQVSPLCRRNRLQQGAPASLTA